jgi:hypothetical protein
MSMRSEAKFALRQMVQRHRRAPMALLAVFAGPFRRGERHA